MPNQAKAPHEMTAVERAEARKVGRLQALEQAQSGDAAALPERPEDARYEVMTDSWGADPELLRGDLVSKGDVPYDFAWAEAQGAIRYAPEYSTPDRRHLTTTTQPVDSEGRIIGDRPNQTQPQPPPGTEPGRAPHAQARKAE